MKHNITIGSIREQLQDSLTPETIQILIMPELYKLAITRSTGLSAITS
jgi:hypothetical protein